MRKEIKSNNHIDERLKVAKVSFFKYNKVSYSLLVLNDNNSSILLKKTGGGYREKDNNCVLLIVDGQLPDRRRNTIIHRLVKGKNLYKNN